MGNTINAKLTAMLFRAIPVTYPRLRKGTTVKAAIIRDVHSAMETIICETIDKDSFI